VLAIKAAATTGATAGAAAGPEGVVAGAVIGVSAATLVLIGTAVVAKARKSEFEDFARFSIFGNRDEYIDVDWSDTRLCRDQRPYWQLRTLKLLLAQFTLAREGDGSPRMMDTKITLHAGFLEPGCYFVVHVVQEYTNGSGPAYEKPFTTSLIIFPEARRMSQPSREREAFEMSVESVSDFEFLGDPAKGEVQVRIPIKPVTFYVPDGAGVRAVSSGDFPGRCVSSEIRVKLRNRGEDNRLPDVPTDGHSWVRLDTMSGPSSISSFAASKFYKSES
jgi:hypothetical protein